MEGLLKYTSMPAATNRGAKDAFAIPVATPTLAGLAGRVKPIKGVEPARRRGS